MDRVIVYLHGVGGPSRRDMWLEPLNVALRQSGSSPIRPDYDQIIDPDYSGVLMSADDRDLKPPQDNGSRDVEADRLRYAMFTEGARLALKAHGVAAQFDLSATPRWIVDLGAPAVARQLHEAQRYRSSRAARTAVLRHLLNVLPGDREIVLIGHSLGSVVGLDLIRHLPRGTFVRLFVTLGSPLSTPGLWPFLKGMKDDFPYDRVGSWVNIVDGRDPVAGWGRLSAAFPMALDAPVRIGGRHEVVGYFSHPALAAVISDAAYGPSTAVPETSNIARRISSDWNLTLLAFEFSNQLSRSCRPESARWKQRFDTARRILARRTLAEVDHAQRLNPEVEALERPPLIEDLLDHAVEHVRDVWSDEEILPLAVSLYMSSPTAPFDISIDPKHRLVALTRLLENIRQRGGSVSGSEFAERVAAAVRENTKELGHARAGAAWVVLLGMGLAVLALTGFGLAVAVPAGLAGAAAITATLASFGPGGMVGGMLTIAAMTGTGTAFLGAGAVGSATSAGQAPPISGPELVEQFARTLSAMTVDQLRGVLVGALAVCDAGDALEQPDRRTRLQLIIETALAEAAEEQFTHQRLAPKGKSAENWKQKKELLDTALRLVAARTDGRRPIDLRRELEESLSRPGPGTRA